ncbi:MAG: deoxyribodipyrimidine photo-lyase [Armatimonadaceae bacterium]
MEKPHRTAIYWFRRTIRLDDNQSLCAAIADSEHIAPVFILDPAILSRPDTGAARTRFLFESLSALHDALKARGGRLILRHGSPLAELERLVSETGATALYFAADYEPYSRERDTAVTEKMQARDVSVHTFHDHLLSPPGEILTKSEGKPYTVYTPYMRVWFTQAFGNPLSAPERVSVSADPHSEPLPLSPADFGVGSADDQEPVVRGGEENARKQMENFLRRADGGIREYDESRDFPGIEGTSRLSAYLRMGVLSPRRLYHEVMQRRADVREANLKSYETFLRELAWRDFYYQVLWHFPHVAQGAFKQEFDALNWENNEEYFTAWCEGRTGYPFVDAAMRQMNRQAWMHNRARMVVASFLTKDLLIDWRWGERYFMEKLVDGDMAPNNGGWQWAAGTGTDAQPFFRIFNPVSQGEKFDPEGAYVKQWIPELAKVSPKFVHQPWKMSPAQQEAVGCVIGRDYPAPIVDHSVQRERALALYRQV